MQDGTEAARRIELAEIERWFTGDALGCVFHAADGRTWPVDDDDAERTRAEASRIVDAMLNTGRMPVRIAIMGVFALGLFPGLSPIPVSRALVMEVSVALFVALPVWSAARLWVYRRRLRRLRAALAATMAGPVLTKAEPLRFARTNMFRVAQYGWVLLILLALLTLEIAPNALAWLRMIGRVGTLLAIAIVMGVAWVLYFAAERVDRVQARRPERLVRIP